MANLFEITVTDFLFFTLLFFRTSSLIITMPFFGGSQTPYSIRIALVIAIGFVMFNTIDASQIAVPESIWEYAIFIGREISIGIVIGFLASIPFFAVQLGGEIIAINMGLTQTEAIDPLSQSNVPSIGQMLMLFVMVIFLLANGHHYLLQMLVDSFEYVPIGTISYSQAIVDYCIESFNVVTLLGMKVAVPILIADLVLLTTFAFMARLVPQMNLFILSLPFKLGMGMIISIVCFPLIGVIFYETFGEAVDRIYHFLTALKVL